jgi:hypothetical protein
MALFEEAKVEVEKQEPPTIVRIGKREPRVQLYKKRREALEKLKTLLAELEGKDVYISFCNGARGHFWLNNLKLTALKVESLAFGSQLPSVVVLRGRKEACIRIFTDRVVNLRQQEYQGYTMWLLDFWNGWGEYPLDQYRPLGYESLDIIRFKD